MNKKKNLKVVSMAADWPDLKNYNSLEINFQFKFFE